MLFENCTVLFQGDSVTDCGRSRDNDDNPGIGYAAMVANQVGALYPALNVKFVNRGTSGNKVKDLNTRFDRDFLSVAPDIITILIGINDVWRRYDSNDPTSAEEYESGYNTLLSSIKNNLPEATIILLDPFVLHTTDRAEWHEDLDPKIQVVRKLAREYNCVYLPLDGIFASASVLKEPAYWAADGVHPTRFGHALIAEKLLEILL